MTEHHPQSNSGQTWRLPELDDLELMRAEYATHRFPRHYHDTYVIEVVEAGEDEFFCRDATYRARAGEIVVIPPGEVHTGRSAGAVPLAYRSFYPSPQLLSFFLLPEGKECSLPLPFDARVIRDQELADLLCAAHRGLEAPTERCAAESLLTLALARLVTRHAQSPTLFAEERPEPLAVRRARDYLADHVTENVSLHELSAIVGLSPFHLLRVFRREVGLAPHEYLLNERIRRARILLNRGVPIGEIACELGFADQSHFTRRFKQTVGVSPGQYAEKRNFVQDSLPPSVV
jgi:AraC-like DNA-binding protein